MEKEWKMVSTLAKKMNLNFQNLFQLELQQLLHARWLRLKNSEGAVISSC